MKEFILIRDYRIRKSCIKKYIPTGERQLNIYYSASRNKIDVEMMGFENSKERDEAIDILDTHFIL